LEYCKNINGKKINHVSVPLLNMNGHLSDKLQIIVNTFIKFFLTAADNITDDNTNNSNGAAININFQIIYTLHLDNCFQI
jgi:hypothetical protein